LKIDIIFVTIFFEMSFFIEWTLLYIYEIYFLWSVQVLIVALFIYVPLPLLENEMMDNLLRFESFCFNYI